MALETYGKIVQMNTKPEHCHNWCDGSLAQAETEENTGTTELHPVLRVLLF